jgi:hypothetical protein
LFERKKKKRERGRERERERRRQNNKQAAIAEKMSEEYGNTTASDAPDDVAVEGKSMHMDGTSGLHRKAFDQLQEAIDLIPLDEREAYAEAYESCPHLIRSESPPIYWLRYAKYDVWAAAQRMVKYWEWRKVLFKERAFLPLLDISGNGALDEDDIELLETGFFVRLPTSKLNTPRHEQQQQQQQ